MDPGWPKWLTCRPTSALWYSPQEFGSLIAAHIARGSDLTIRQLISTFDGFSGSAKQKLALDEADLSRQKLADFVVDGELDHERIEHLLGCLHRNSREIKPKKLGVIGEDYLRERFLGRGGDKDQFRYKCFAGIEDGLPFVIEAAFAYMPEWHRQGWAGEIMAGVNWAASVSRLPLQLGSDWTLDRLLNDCRANRDEPIFLFLHLATPTPGLVNWLGKGKNIANLKGEIAEKLKTAIRLVTKDWKKLRDSEDKSSAKAERREEQLRKQKAKPEMSLKDAILMEIPDAIAEVSGNGQYPFNDRNFYYAIRPRVQKRGVTSNLTQKYFDRVVEEWEKANGIIELRHRDPRGHLIEPHTGRIVPLGTAQVNDYEIPTWRFHTILFVEKKGFGPLFQKSLLAEKYDIAIVSSEGYAVDAAKMLLSRAQQEQQITILCLHDADPHGKNIARTLRKATPRSDVIKVIDIGLSLDDAIEMNLPTEHFERQRKLPKGLELTPLENTHWSGRLVRHNKKGNPVYRCERVELNALAASPSAFIAYVEQQLEKHGCRQKLIPPDEVIRDYAAEERHEKIHKAVRRELQRILDIENLTRKISKGFMDEVDVIDMQRFLKNWKAKLDPESWQDAASDEIQQRVKELIPQIQHAVKKAVKI